MLIGIDPTAVTVIVAITLRDGGGVENNDSANRFGDRGDRVDDGLVAISTERAATLRGWFFQLFLGAKRLELLRELVPQAIRIAVLANPALPNTEAELRAVEQAAEEIGQQLVSYG